jgi:predicted HTH transcriptional regulator
MSLKSLISAGEHQQQDFKFRIDNQKKIARTLAACANTDGGSLLIGVKDNGKIAGINPEEEFHMIQGAATLFCKPALEFSHTIWQEELKLVLEISIEPQAKKNIHALDDDGKWKIYFRHEDKTLLANKILLKVWRFNDLHVEKPAILEDKYLEILQIIEKNEQVTLSQLYKFSSLKKNEIDHYLALFIYWGNVKYVYQNEQFRYTCT